MKVNDCPKLEVKSPSGAVQLLLVAESITSALAFAALNITFGDVLHGKVYYCECFILNTKYMKKFAVLGKIGSFKPMVVEDFDDVKDAAAYANIMRRRYPNREYSVFQLNEEL